MRFVSDEQAAIAPPAMGALMVTRLRWTKFPENPVLPGVAETWEAWTADPTVVYRDGVYHLWYTGAGRKPWKIFYASSRDGLRWSKAERPVNEEGHRASVVHHDGLWRMYLTLGGRGSDVHLQVSPRPEGPFRDEGPVLKPDAPWEEGKLWCPDAVYDEDERLWKMWYSAGEVRAGAGWPEPKAIGYAVSPDGRRWTKCTKNPILVPRGDSSWLGRAICTLMVVKREGRYYGFTNGVGDDGHSRIGLTTSADGLRWDLEPDSLILDLGAPGQFDAAHLFAPAAAYGHAGWRLWYNGKCDREGSAVESIGGARGE